MSGTQETDFFARVKERVKRVLGGRYPALVNLCSPVFVRTGAGEFVRSFDLERARLVNLGSGSTRFHRKVLNLDIRSYAGVDCVADLTHLPLADASIDGIVSVAVLEHVRIPRDAVREMERVLRPGGKICIYIPFMQGIHASPSDYRRYTPHGLEVLFREFENRRVRIGAGPTSGVVWLLQEWLAMLLSLGSRRLYWFWYFVLFAITPLKFLDFLLARHPMAAQISSGFTLYAEKP
jgi:SAM-dependent methyltransferase